MQQTVNMENVMSSLPHLNIVEENNLYAVGWVRNMDEIKEVLSSFMGKTNLDYRMYRKTKNFGYRDMPKGACTVRFSNTVKNDDEEKSKLPSVPFQGFGFIILPGESYMGCKFGSNYSYAKNEKRKAQRQAENPKLKTRKPRTSIKLGCPAQIMIKETFCFVDYQCEYSQYHVKKLQGILREKLLAGEGLNVEKRLYIRLPKTTVHQFHEIPEITDGDTSMDTSALLRSSMIIKPEGADDDDNDMDVPEPDDDDLDQDNMSIQSVARPVKPTWTVFYDEKYSDVYGWVGTAEKAERLLREYERVTNTHFVPQKLSKELGSSEVISLEGQRIIWEDGGFTSCTGDGELRIPFEGCPMILLNVKIYKCELGKYKKVKGVAHYGCWMYVKMKEVIVFPEYALPEGLAYNVVERMKMQNRLSADVKEGNPVEAQRRIYIALIPPEDHKHSVTMGRPNDVSPDQQLCDRMRDLISMGISSSDLITRHLHNMTVNEIYKDKKPPSRDNKKFFPTEAKIGDYLEVSKRTTKFDGVNFKTRAREREEVLAACKSLMEDCEKMMHFICGKTALDDVRDKLELLHQTMKLYTPDMTHPEVNEVLPYIMDGVEPPTPHQRALAALGKGKLTGATYSPKKKKRKRGEGDVYSEHNVSDLTSLFTNEDSDDSDASNLSAGYSHIIEPQPTEEAELTAVAAQSLVEINQPFHITTANQTVLEATSQPVYQTTVTTIPQAESSSTQQYATLTPIPITKTSLIKTSTPKAVKTTPVIKVLRNPVKGSSPVKVEVGGASFLQLLPGAPVTVQKVVTVTGDDSMAQGHMESTGAELSIPPSHVETTGTDLSVGLNIETQSDDQMGEIT